MGGVLTQVCRWSCVKMFERVSRVRNSSKKIESRACIESRSFRGYLQVFVCLSTTWL